MSQRSLFGSQLKLRLRTKVTVLLLALSLGPLFLAGLISLNRAVHRGKRDAQLRYAQAAAHTAHAFSDLFDRTLTDAHTLARRFPTITFDFEAARRAVDTRQLQTSVGWDDVAVITALNSHYAAALLALPDGQIFHLHPYHNVTRLDLATQSWFQGIPTNGGLFLTKLGPLTGGRPGLLAVVPIHHPDGRLAAWLGLLLERGRLAELIERSFSVGEDRFGVMGLLAPDGTLVVRTRPRTGSTPWRMLPQLSEGGTFEIGEYILTRRFLKRSNWSTQLVTPTRYAYRHVYLLIWLLVGVIVLTFVFVLLFADYMATVLLHPIEALDQGAEMIGRGALDYRIEMADHQADELGGLARSFNKMAENLQKSEQKIRRYSRTLETANEELDAMVFAITHDLKDALEQITEHAADLQQTHSTELGIMGLAELETVIERTHFIRRLSDDLLALVEHDRGPSELISFDLGDLLKEVRNWATEQKLGRVVFSAELPEIIGDRDRLLLVFNNLVDNALNYNKAAKPTVKIQCTDRSFEWQIDVTDNGIGIAVADQVRIFNLFERLDESASPSTGAGLNLVRRIIERHRGTITVDSTVGQGTCFTILLPKEASIITSPSIDIQG